MVFTYPHVDFDQITVANISLHQLKKNDYFGNVSMKAFSVPVNEHIKNVNSITI